MSRVVICYGALRSGTTLLRLMLNQHSQLHCHAEADFLIDHLTFDAAGQPNLNTKLLEQDRFRKSISVPMPRATGREAVAEMIQSLHPGGDKTLVLILHRGLTKLHHLFPDIPIVHLVRDPRDVARSSIGMGWAGNVYYGVDHWIRTETEWDQFTQATGAKADLEMRYEDLIHDPEANLRAFLAVVGLEWEPSMLRYDRESTYDKPQKNLVEQWRDKQSPLEIALVEGQVEELMHARGYALDQEPLRQPGTLLRVHLWVQDVVFRWRFQFRNFGLVDPILEFIGRRLGIKAIYLPARRRIGLKKDEIAK